MTVNGRDTLLSGFNSGGIKNVGSITVPVTLKAGPNTVRFSNATANLPDLDAVSIDLNRQVTSVATAYLRAPGMPALQVRVENDLLEIRTGGQVLQGGIFDASGRLVRKVNRKKIALHSLSSGVYRLVLRSSGGMAIRQFLKW